MHEPTILYDRTGERCQKGQGLQIFVDAQPIASAPQLQRITAKMPETSAGWRKYEEDAIVGGQNGRSLISWSDVRGSSRPKRSLALFESTDGIHCVGNVAVTWPDVIWDEQTKPFRMWYSGGGYRAIVHVQIGIAVWYFTMARTWVFRRFLEAAKNAPLG